MLGNVKLLESLKAYPKESITKKMYRSFRKILTENEKHEITVKNLGTVGKAGAGLLVWVLKILCYYEVLQQAEPLRKHVKTMENAQLKTESKLLQLQHLLKELNIELIKLNKAYVDTANKLSELQAEAMLLEKPLMTASTVTAGLTEEQNRWIIDVKELERKCDTIVGDCFLATSFLPYAGSFDAKY